MDDPDFFTFQIEPRHWALPFSVCAYRWGNWFEFSVWILCCGFKISVKGGAQ